MPGKSLRDVALGQLAGCEMGLTLESEEGEIPHLRWSHAPPLPWPRPGSADIFREKMAASLLPDSTSCFFPCPLSFIFSSVPFLLTYLSCSPSQVCITMYYICICNMGVSINKGAPKWMAYNGKSY